MDVPNTLSLTCKVLDLPNSEGDESEGLLEIRGIDALCLGGSKALVKHALAQFPNMFGHISF